MGSPDGPSGGKGAQNHGTRDELAIFGRRLKDAQPRRMNQNIQAIHQETGKNRLFLLCDMVWCTLRYGVGYLDYHVFGFARNRGANRKTFMTMNHNVSLARMVNDAAYYPLLNDKFQFLQRYGAFLGRRWLDLRQAGPQELAQLCQDCGVVFAKPHGEFGGKGVERLEPGPDTDFEALAPAAYRERSVFGGGSHPAASGGLPPVSPKRQHPAGGDPPCRGRGEICLCPAACGQWTGTCG